MIVALILYAGSLATLLAVGAWRDRELSSANLAVCGSLALLFAATMLKADLVGISPVGVAAIGTALNASVLVGSGFHPPRMYRVATSSTEAYQRLRDAGASDEELDAFDAPSGGTRRSVLLFVIAVVVIAAARPGWFGL